ncbi:MAG TPA: CDP-alcohol phosphatidyltransferase family protein [Dissulfurispiraceae bacterium]|nr:CDP-alcohol phosphatidyltransferase family protein [Dissulfurispiraceae bacterium]
MLSAKLGHFLDKPLAPIARKIPLSPNVISVIGFVITLAASVVLPFHIMAGGLLILLGGLFDILDGIVARINEQRTKFGAFLDSTLDRYSDSCIFIALAWYFFRMQDQAGLILTLGCLVGALLISYVRARAEGLGISCHVGLMERPERVVLIAAGCMSGWIIPVLVILLVLSHLTVIHRIFHVFRETARRGGQGERM